jgi:hypothetical protein
VEYIGGHTGFLKGVLYQVCQGGVVFDQGNAVHGKRFWKLHRHGMRAVSQKRTM